MFARWLMAVQEDLLLPHGDEDAALRTPGRRRPLAPHLAAARGGAAADAAGSAAVTAAEAEAEAEAEAGGLTLVQPLSRLGFVACTLNATGQSRVSLSLQ